MIAARRGEDAANIGFAPAHIIEIDQPAADFKGADRRMVFVLDP